MAESTLLSIAFFLICVLFIMLLIAFTKLNTMHKRLADVSPKDLYPFMEELRELVIETERVADRLEDAIKKKEELLEDVASLAEEKIKRLESMPSSFPSAYRNVPQHATMAQPVHQPVQSHYTLPRQQQPVYQEPQYVQPIPYAVQKPQYPSDQYAPAHQYIPQPQKQASLSIRERIADLLAMGMSDAQIASELGISTTEVSIVRKMEIR